MKYSNYKLENFLTDELFRSWVIRPDHESDFFWASFVENNPEKYTTILQAKEIILSLKSSKIDDQIGNEEIDFLFGKILENKSNSGSNTQSKVNWRSVDFHARFLKVAATLFVISCIGIYWFFNEISVSSKETYVAATITKETLKGQKMTVRLPDNSVVVLNSNSRLEYPSSFAHGKRQLRLHGEAFFDVVKDNNRPFIIESGGFYTQVKGTSFAIKKATVFNTIEVSVVTGNVEVSYALESNAIKKVEIEAMQMVSYDMNTKDFVKAPLDFDEMIAWKDGTIHFHNSNFNEIVDKLENWYGVSFTINKSIDRLDDFSGEWTNESLDLVLNGLSFTYNFDYQINGEEIILK